MSAKKEKVKKLLAEAPKVGHKRVPRPYSTLSGEKPKYIGRMRTMTEKHIHAASLVAEGRLKNAQICKQVGISNMQLLRMKHMPEFQAEVDRQINNFRNRVAGAFLGIREKRVKQRDDLYRSLQKIRKSRAEIADEDPELAAQGGATGLVVAQNVYSRDGKIIDTKYAVDHPTIDQMRSLMKDQADDIEGNGSSGVAVTIVLSKEEQSWL